MSDLKVRLFGYIEVNYGEDILLGPKAKALFAYLLLNRNQFHAREQLANLFWGDRSEKQARRCLNTTLWRLRNKLDTALHKSEDYLLTGSRGEISFNLASDYWLDIAEFNQHLQQLLHLAPNQLSPSQVTEIENAIQLYRGDLMEGFYNEWVVQEREKQRAIFIKSLLHLLAYYHHHQNYEKSIPYGKHLLTLEPLREDIHRDLMQQYYESGQIQNVYLQYEKCRQILREELGVIPTDETRRLFDQLIQSPILPKEGPLAHHQELAIMSQQINSLKDEIIKLQQTMAMLISGQKELF
ncbi:MAG: BTAD domain-containing putative transcriptional regulator [Chloroflexota bacterium]